MAQQIASEDGTTNAMLTRCSAFVPSATNLPAPAARCAEDAISFSWHPMLMQDRPPWPPPFQVEMLVCSIASDLFGRGKSEVALRFGVSSSPAALLEWGVSLRVIQQHFSDVPFIMSFACQIEAPVHALPLRKPWPPPLQLEMLGDSVQLRPLPWPSFSCHMVLVFVQREKFLSRPNGMCIGVWLLYWWKLHGIAAPSARFQLLPSFYDSTALQTSLVIYSGLELLLIAVQVLDMSLMLFLTVYSSWLDKTQGASSALLAIVVTVWKWLYQFLIYLWMLLHQDSLCICGVYYWLSVPDQKELLQYLANFILNQQWFTFVQVVGVFFHAHSPSVHLTLWDPGGGLCALAAYKSQITDEAQDLVCCQMNRPYNIELFQLQPLFRANISVPSSDIVLLLLATVVHVDSGVLEYCSEALLVMSELLSAPMVGIGPWLPPIQLDMQKSVIQLRPIHELSFTGFVVVVLWNKLFPLLFSDSVSKYLRGSLMLSCVQKQWPLLLHLYRSFHQSLPHADFPYVPSDEALILAMATKLWGGSAISVSIRLQCQVAAVLEKYRWSLPHAIIFASLQILLWLSCNQLGISVHAASLLVCNGLLMGEFSFSSQRLFMLADFLMGIKIWYMTSIRLSLCIIQFYHLVETNAEQIHFLFEHMARFSLGITGCLHEHTSFYMGIILKVEQELIKLITYWRLLLCVLQFYHQVVDDP